MLSNKDYIIHSLETSLFFLRIAKEHAIFAAASLPPRDIAVSHQLVGMKNTFEKLLSRAVMLSNGIISREVISSGELVTNLTLATEKTTQFLTGIPIDTSITERELKLNTNVQPKPMPQLLKEVSVLNKTIITTTNSTIAFLSNILKSISSCKSFSYVYPTMIEHVLEETKFFLMIFTKLENKNNVDTIKDIIGQEILWTEIMGEHAGFIRGYLDPSEKNLFEKANDFVKEFDVLQKETNNLVKQSIKLPEVTKKNLNAVTNLRDFKKQGTQGILSCKIKSVIPPLLADHVTREANHFLRLLRDFSTIHNV